jgi:hydrogenase maturation protein HypF
MSLSYLVTVFGDIPYELEKRFDHLDINQKSLVLQAIQNQINTPLTSSCGRLFDAVAALLGLRRTISFEGQAAMDLEMIASPEESLVYPFNLTEENGMILFQPQVMIASIVTDYLAGAKVDVIAGRFHSTLGVMIEEVCSMLRSKTGLNRVVLSGGVFQNLLLTEKTVTALEKSGFEILLHSRVPPNDGGVSLGQAAIAAYRLRH